MKNWIKTAIAAGAIALNVVVAEAATAVGVFESLIDETLCDSRPSGENKLYVITGTSRIINYYWEDDYYTYIENIKKHLPRDSAMVDVNDAAVDGESNGWLRVSGLAASECNNKNEEPATDKTPMGDIERPFEPIVRETLESNEFVSGPASVSSPSVPAGPELPDSIAEVYGGEKNESVPEPSLIIGSLLAVAAGTKVLKRGNQK